MDIHKITFSTVKKYTFTQLAFGSYLHALHRQFRLATAFQDTRHKLLTAKEQCGMKISDLQKINSACLYSYLIRYQIIRHVAFTKLFVPVFNHYMYRMLSVIVIKSHLVNVFNNNRPNSKQTLILPVHIKSQLSYAAITEKFVFASSIIFEKTRRKPG